MPKFSDIRQYTSDSSHSSSMPLRYLVSHIDKLIEEHNLEMNPDFQRGHVWTEDKQIAFMEYLLRGGMGSDEIRLNQPGWMRDFSGPLVLVDGLQRLTACLRFLRNEIPACGYFRNEYEDDRTLNTIWLTLKTNNLQTRAEVLNWYVEINQGGVAHTDEEIDKVKGLLREEMGDK